MLCGKCKKNQATKTYETLKNGKKQIEYFCLECYHSEFVYVEESEVRSSCPYCGTSVSQIKKTSLVGCAQCYKMLAHAVYPMITKMQGGEKHNGKCAYDTESKRIARRLNELNMMAQKYYQENDDKSAAIYEEKIDELHAKKEGEAIWHSQLLSNPS